MPVVPTYPGVYIEEVPSGVRTIAGVATSIAAFIDCFNRGPLNRAVQILNIGDFEREFGGLRADSEASYAIEQFFLNGGTEAWVVRAENDAGTPNGLQSAQAVVATSPTGATALTITAMNEGTWGNSLRARIEAAPAANTFNLYVSEIAISGTTVTTLRQEVFRNLTMAAGAHFVDDVVNDENSGSRLVRVAATGNTPPAVSAFFTRPLTEPLVLAGTRELNVAVDGGANVLVTVPAPAGTDLEDVAEALQTGLRGANPANPVLAQATVEVFSAAGVDRLRIVPGFGAVGGHQFLFSAAGAATTALELGVIPDAGVDPVRNVGVYVLGGGAIADSAQTAGQAGENGLPPTATEILGSRALKSGLFALEDVDLFNILCIPAIFAEGYDETQRDTVLAVAEAYVEERRAFLILDTPFEIERPPNIRAWLAARDTLRHRNAALLYPRVMIADRLNDFRLRSFGASGTAAGLFARIDVARGVWKAPAGTEATLRNVSELDYVMTDAENGTLNPLAINCLRQFPIYGNVNWGARTLVGSDQQASEWRYIPVRRLALMLEESLYRGTKWVVFEPNDEPLWAQIRLNVGSFMHNLFREGAFQGRTPQEAYLVKCDRETTTQADINAGVVNILVGFAPLQPAEFVIIRIQQLAGQLQT